MMKSNNTHWEYGMKILQFRIVKSLRLCLLNVIYPREFAQFLVSLPLSIRAITISRKVSLLQYSAFISWFQLNTN